MKEVIVGVNGFYYWTTVNYHYDNEVTMIDFIENHLPSYFEVIYEDGTYVEVENLKNGYIYSLQASGNGDSYNHKVEFNLIRINK